jgi:hypothetical protein
MSNLRDATSSSAQSFINDLLVSSLPSTSVDGAKQALSLRTTTSHFFRFVHKTGPVFDVSDAIEGIVRWQNPLATLLVGCVWALICLYPALVLLGPSVAVSTILLYNHSRRFPPSPISIENPYQESHMSKAPPSGQPPTEGSVEYFTNLQNIQELMGRVSDITDKGRSLVPYFNWSDEATSMLLLQLSSAVTIVLALVLYLSSSYLDIRYVFLVLGDSALLACHPVSISMAQALWQSGTARFYLRKIEAIGQNIVRDDALPDEYVFPNRKGERRVIKEIVVYENERKSLDGTWSSEPGKGEKDKWQPWEVLLDGQAYEPASSSTPMTRRISDQGLLASSTSSSMSTMHARETMRFDTIEPPKNFIWVDSEVWQIDRLGLWTAQLGQSVPSAGHVDGDGWACIDADGQLMKTEQLSQVGKGRAAMRRRRWQKRIVSVPTY